MNYKETIKNIFIDILETNECNEAKIRQYFHPDYVQHVDGKTLNFNDFIQHVKALKSSTATVKIVVERLVSEGNTVCSIHYAQGSKRNGRSFKTKVIALFQFEGNKIIRCDELTHLIQGEESDKTLGSTTNS
jgi:ketosteroid isomerase-like protein